MAKLPYVPAVLEATNVLFALSTSVLVNVPLVLNGASVSVRATVALLTVAASFVPLMVISTVLAVPSSLVTLKVSV